MDGRIGGWIIEASPFLETGNRVCAVHTANALQRRQRHV